MKLSFEVVNIPILIKDMVSNLRIISGSPDQNSNEVDLAELLEAIELHQEERSREAKERQYRDSSDM